MVKLLVAALVPAIALSQSTLDPTQGGAYPGYPAYLDTSCPAL